MRLGYNTNGMAHHDVLDAVALLADLGYRSVAVTIDHAALSPSASDRRERLELLRRRLERFEMRSVIETGARFLLDPSRKHEPTLISPDPAGRSRRIAFYQYAVDCAAALGSDCVSLWSGGLDAGVAEDQATGWLVAGLDEVLQYAANCRVAIGFEPEPGMLVDSMSRFDALAARLDSLRLTLDIGHLHCQGETPIADVVRRYAPRLVNVHIEDMRRGVHEHLMFGEGEIDFPPILEALADSGYSGGVHVELSRHSAEAPVAARRAYEFLSAITTRASRSCF